jgi:Na+-translocating ferredoxin:NAD+ oxidoreductase RnfA subunit
VGRSASNYVFVGFLLQLIGFGLAIIVSWYFYAVSLQTPYAYSWVIGVLTAVGSALAILFLYAVHQSVYRRLVQEEYEGARTPLLVVGILSLVLGLIPGIFYLVGYAQLRQAIRERPGTPRVDWKGGVIPVPPPPPMA